MAGTLDGEQTIMLNRIAMKQLLLDTIIHLKMGRHLIRNYQSLKKVFCVAKGISPLTRSEKLLEHLAWVYNDNGLLDDFNQTCTKMGYLVNVAV